MLGSNATILYNYTVEHLRVGGLIVQQGACTYIIAQDRMRVRVWRDRAKTISIQMYGRTANEQNLLLNNGCTNWLNQFSI